jgi:predicted transcriptional regulator
MKLTIRTDGFEGFMKRSMERAKKIDRGERLTPERSITFESPLDLLEALSAERMRLFELTKTKEFSVTSLAKALGRDPKSVRRDVMKLMKVGMLRTREQVNPGHGRMKIVEPVAERFELKATF